MLLRLLFCVFEDKLLWFMNEELDLDDCFRTVTAVAKEAGIVSFTLYRHFGIEVEVSGHFGTRAELSADTSAPNWEQTLSSSISRPTVGLWVQVMLMIDSDRSTTNGRNQYTGSLAYGDRILIDN